MTELTKQINEMIKNLQEVKRNIKKVEDPASIKFMKKEIQKIAIRIPELIEESVYMN